MGSTLKDIQTVCARAERNYREVANHLGSELEICARLLAAYLDLTPNFQPIQIYGRELSGWFSDVGAVSAWLRDQIVAFGKRLWTEKDSVSRVVPFPALPAKVKKKKHTPPLQRDGTLSEISQSVLAEDEDRTVMSVLDAVLSQDEMLRVRDLALSELLLQANAK